MEYFIKAASKVILKHPETQFLLVGDIISEEPKFLKYKQALVNLVNKLDISDNFHITGIRRDVVNIYSVSDIFVLPSLFDVFPTTILEAMAMELPVIATDVGGVSEQIISGEDGYFNFACRLRYIG